MTANLLSYTLTELREMDKQLPSISPGYITVEYAIVSAAIAITLFMPIPGAGDGSLSLIDLVMGAIRQFQAHTTVMLALP